MIDRSEHPREYILDVLKATFGLTVIVLIIKCLEPNEMYSDSSIAQSLVQQASKWHAMSIQDKQLIYATQHINYAVAYLNAARHAASDSALERLTGIDLHKLYKSIDDQQMVCNKDIVQKIYGKGKVKNLHAHSGWLS